MRTDSADQNYFRFFRRAQINKVTLKRLVSLDSRELGSVDDDRLLSCAIFTFSYVLIDFLFQLMRLATLQLQPILRPVEQLAALTDVDRGFDFVPRQNPNLNARLLNVLDCLAHILLKFVLNRGTTS